MANVLDLINDARNQAADILANSGSQIAAAALAVNSVGRTIGGQGMPEFNLNAPVPFTVRQVPQYSGETFADPGFTAAAPELLEIPQLDMSGAPGAAPSVVGFTDPGTQPTGEPGDVTLLQGVPDISTEDINIPEAPDLMERIGLIEKPRITAIRIPNAPTYQAPQFLGRSPSAPPTQPTNLDATLRSAYAEISPVMRQAVEAHVDGWIDHEFPGFRSGLAALETRLETYLAGGTALTPEVQDQLYSRATEKSDAEYRRQRDNLYGEAARAGHTLLPAILLAKVQEVDKGRRDGNAAVARDLMVKMAELEQSNVQFAVSQSANLRGVMIGAALNYYSGLIQINGQALDYARSVVDAIVRTYEAAIRITEVEARIYEAEGNIYQAKVRGAMAVLEAYQAQVRGLEAQANVDTAMVNAFKAQIDAVQAEAAVYRAQVEGATAKVQLSRAKVDIFQARAQAYGTQVNAWTAQWSGYEAAVRGETAKVQASAEQVRAYQAQTEAWRTLINARVAEVDGIVKRNDGFLRQYQTAADVYRIQVGALAEVDRARIESFSLTLKGIIAQAESEAAHSRAEIAQFEASLRAVIASSESIFRQIHEAHELDIHRADALARLATTAAENWGRLGQAVASGMNTLVAQTMAQQSSTT